MCNKKSQEPPKCALPTNDTRHIFPIKDGPVTKETCHCQKWQGVWTQFPYVILWHNGVEIFMRSYYHFYYASTVSKHKGHLISKRYSSFKKRTKIFCPSRPGQKLKFSKFVFWKNWGHQNFLSKLSDL